MSCGMSWPLLEPYTFHLLLVIFVTIVVLVVYIWVTFVAKKIISKILTVYCLIILFLSRREDKKSHDEDQSER